MEMRDFMIQLIKHVIGKIDGWLRDALYLSSTPRYPVKENAPASRVARLFTPKLAVIKSAL